MKLSERFWNKRKGFTIVELVIVIAIIAILAAVLIPTFSNVIQRSKISADTQLCRNLNTVLTMATSEGRIPQSMYDVLYLISESGYLLANLNPTAEGYYYAWDSEGQKMVYIREDLETVVYPEDYKIDKSKCWITVGDQAEAERIATAGYNLYLENNIETIELHNTAVSIDTGAYKLGNLVVDGSVNESTTVVLAGNFGTTSFDVGNANFSTTGSIQNLSVGANTAGVTINGSISSFSAASGFSGVASMSSTGIIGTINSGTVTAGTTTFNSDTTGKISGSVANGGVVTMSTKEAIENVRSQIAGGRTFEGETLALDSDINMAGIAFQPMSNNARAYDRIKSMDTWFKGTFDGQGHTISNFSTQGFSIAGLNAGTNETSVKFNGVTYDEAIYGLFGAIYVPYGETITIKNLTITCDIRMVLDDAEKNVGDSVGGLIGFAFGAGTLVIENVTVNGTVNGYDGVAGLIGRAYGVTKTNLTKTSGKEDKYCEPVAKEFQEAGRSLKQDYPLAVKFVNCTNNATVNAIRKAGGFIGSASGATITYEGCANYGNITSAGYVADYQLGAGLKDYDASTANTKNGDGYYRAGAAGYDDRAAGSVAISSLATKLPANFQNFGVIKIADYTLQY